MTKLDRAVVCTFAAEPAEPGGMIGHRCHTDGWKLWWDGMVVATKALVHRRNAKGEMTERAELNFRRVIDPAMLDVQQVLKNVQMENRP